MTLDLNAIKARVEAATPGPWHIVERFGISAPGMQGYEPNSWACLATCNDGETCRGDKDAAFIAHARQDIPALLQEIERLTAERDGAREDRVTLCESFNAQVARLTADHAALRTHKDALQNYIVEMWEAFRPYLTPELQAKWDAARAALGGGERMTPRLVRPLPSPGTHIVLGGYNYSVTTDPKIPHGVFRLFGSNGKGVQYDANTGEITDVARCVHGTTPPEACEHCSRHISEAR